MIGDCPECDSYCDFIAATSAALVSVFDAAGLSLRPGEPLPDELRRLETRIRAMAAKESE